MTYESHRRRRVGNRVLHPETPMTGCGCDPKLSEGSRKPPVFQRPLEYDADLERAPG